jgi:hypothetical protein
MVSIIISILITLGTVVTGTDSSKKGTSTSTSPTAVINGGTSTWTNGGAE